MFKKILVAFDGSEGAFRALREAIALAGRDGSEISLATVVNLPGLPRGERLKNDHLSGKRTPFQKELELAATMVIQEDLPVSTHLLRGQTPKTLVEFCEKNNYDLVLAGSRGKNSLKKGETGSFATHLFNSLPGKTKVVKADDSEVMTA